MTAEPSTRQRPWWQVAPFPQLAESRTPEAVAHFAAMALAYQQALEPAIINARNGKEMDRARATWWLPMTAAFHAAASMQSWPVERIRDTLADPGDVADWCHDWLEAAGINPDEIGPAQ